jgi:long-chain acyl-CoA synthetase
MTEPQTIVSLVDILANSLRRYGNLELFGTRTQDQWRYVTYAEFGKFVDEMRGGLATLGVGKGDKVGIISNNRLEWAVTAYAVYGLGAVIVPMYEAQNDKDWEYIIRDSELRVLFVANATILEKVKSFSAKIPTLDHLALFTSEPDGKATGTTSYQELLKKGAAQPVPVVRSESTDVASLPTCSPCRPISPSPTAIAALLSSRGPIRSDTPASCTFSFPSVRRPVSAIPPTRSSPPWPR